MSTPSPRLLALERDRLLAVDGTHSLVLRALGGRFAIGVLDGPANRPVRHWLTRLRERIAFALAAPPRDLDAPSAARPSPGRRVRRLDDDRTPEAVRDRLVQRHPWLHI